MITKETLRRLQLIVFDIDGTLLNDKGEIGKDTIRLVSELKNLGLKFSFATGRLHSSIIPFVEQLGLRCPLISLDGTLIKSYPENKVFFESFIPSKKVIKVINYADKFLMKVALCHAEAIYFNEYNSMIPEMIDKFGAVFEEIESYSDYISETLEIVLVSEYKDNLKFIKNRLSFPYTLGLSTNFYRSHSKGGVYGLEIRKSGSTKATGLKRLLKQLKIDIKNTAVLGDWYNDRSLFETKAVKVAVANAVAELKYLADIVTVKTNNEDGTAEFLEMVLRAKKSKTGSWN